MHINSSEKCFEIFITSIKYQYECFVQISNLNNYFEFNDDKKIHEI